MKYTVIWVPDAEQELAAIWIAAADRDAVTAAAHQVDQDLRRDPDTQGESRPEGRRIVLEHPLGVLFTIQPQDRIVYVLTVWHFD
jgi:hypothetical protein